MPLQDAAAGSPAAVATHTIAERLIASLAQPPSLDPRSRSHSPRPVSSSLRATPRSSLLSSAPLLGATR